MKCKRPELIAFNPTEPKVRGINPDFDVLKILLNDFPFCCFLYLKLRGLSNIKFYNYRYTQNLKPNTPFRV